MSDYELGLVNEAKKGKKKALDRLYDACHKELCEVIEAELGDRSRSETILRAVFENIKVQIVSLDSPAMFEELATRLTVEECRKYPKSDAPAESSGASQFNVYSGSDSAEQNQSQNQNQNQNQYPSQEELERERREQFAQSSGAAADVPFKSLEDTLFATSPVVTPHPQNVQQNVQQNQQRMVQQPAPPRGNEPIVAWLVCVNGVERGKIFTIRDKLNIVGSAPNNDIVIHGEANIAPENHACIAYDSKSTACLLLPGAKGIVNLNGVFNDYAQPLNTFDIITFGNSQYVYAPYSEGLDWKKNYGL